MNGNMERLVKGLMLGCTGKVLLRSTAREELLLHSYNGVVLPNLPQWDREKYPYAAILGYTRNAITEYPDADYLKACILLASSTPLYIAKSSDYPYLNEYFLWNLTGCRYWMGDVSQPKIGWKRNSKAYGYDSREVYDPDLSYDQHRFLWANHDITYGSKVVVSASEPVPVYE